MYEIGTGFEGVADDEEFIKLSAAARVLYFQLSIKSDENDVVRDPERIMERIKVSDKEMQDLIDKGFIDMEFDKDRGYFVKIINRYD